MSKSTKENNKLLKRLKENTNIDRDLENVLNLISESQIRIDKNFAEIEYLDEQIDLELESLQY